MNGTKRSAEAVGCPPLSREGIGRGAFRSRLEASAEAGVDEAEVRMSA